MTGPLIRIFLRYLAGYLVIRGVLDQETGALISTDPDIHALLEAGLGIAIAVATEGYYALAKRFGWAT